MRSHSDFFSPVGGQGGPPTTNRSRCVIMWNWINNELTKTAHHSIWLEKCHRGRYIASIIPHLWQGRKNINNIGLCHNTEKTRAIDAQKYIEQHYRPADGTFGGFSWSDVD